MIAWQEKEGHVELLAVSKTFPPQRIQKAVDAGQMLFGENRVQEVLSKQPELPAHLRWHLIGHLQSNKIRKVLPHVEVIQSIDSLKLASEIQRIATELGLRPKVYLEVNVGGEGSKHGFSPTTVIQELEALYALDRIEIQGLMCIPPFDPDAQNARRYFSQLRQLRDQMETTGGVPLPGLSMGMSHDFEAASEEGATIVRVGTAILGERQVAA